MTNLLQVSPPNTQMGKPIEVEEKASYKEPESLPSSCTDHSCNYTKVHLLSFNSQLTNPLSSNATGCVTWPAIVTKIELRQQMVKSTEFGAAGPKSFNDLDWQQGCYLLKAFPSI